MNLPKAVLGAPKIDFEVIIIGEFTFVLALCRRPTDLDVHKREGEPGT